MLHGQKIIANVDKISIPLNLMNSIIGKIDIKNDLKSLILKHPEVVSIIPILIASRDKIINVADIGGDILYNFSQCNDIDAVVNFADKTGLLKVLSDKKITNLVDYCYGVEVGLDSNARKNRSGVTMEQLCEVYIKAICEKYSFDYIAQATVDKIKSKFNKEIPTDKADNILILQ